MKKYWYAVVSLLLILLSALHIYGGKYERSFDLKETVSLPKGRYELYVKYDAAENAAFILEQSGGFRTSENQSQTVVLTADEHEMRFDFELPETVSQLSFQKEGSVEIKGIRITSKHLLHADTLYAFLLCLLICAAVGIYLFRGSRTELSEMRRKRLLSVFFLFLVCVFCSSPVFTNFITWGHDTTFHLARIEGIKEGLLSGQFPVMVHPYALDGYGHMAPAYYPELFLYIPALLRMIGFSLTASYHIFLFLINAATIFCAYAAMRHMFGSRWVGILGSVLYALAPYRLTNLYTRAALGEVLAMIFLPLLIGGVYEVFFGEAAKWRILLLGVTGVLQSHIISLLMAGAFCAFFGLLFLMRLREKERMAGLLKAAAGSVLLNLWFLVPFIMMSSETNGISGLQRSFAAYALYVSEVFHSFVSQSAISSDQGIMPVAVGLPLLGGALLAVFHFLRNRQRNTKDAGALFCFAFGLLALLLCTELFPWDVLEQIPHLGSGIRLLQFPWRFYSFATVFLAFAAAYGFYQAGGVHCRKRLMVIAVTFFCIFAVNNLVDDNQMKSKVLYGDEMLPVFAARVVGSGEYLYEGTDTGLLRERGSIVEADGEIRISDPVKKGTNLNFTYSKEEGVTYAEVPLLWYKGYHAVDQDGKNLELMRGANNVMRVMLPEGEEGSVSIRYQGFAAWKAAFGVSLLSLLWIFVLPCIPIQVKIKKG